MKVIDLEVLNCFKALVAGQISELPGPAPRIAKSRVNESLFGSKDRQFVHPDISNEVGVVAGAVATNQRKAFAFLQ